MTPEQPSRERLPSSHYEEDGTYKFESRDSFVANVPNLEDRIKAYQQLKRTPHEEDINALRHQRTKERMQKMDSVLNRKMQLDRVLQNKISAAPQAMKQDWIALRAEFQKEFNALEARYTNPRSEILNDLQARGVLKFATPAIMQTMEQTGDPSLKLHLLDHFNVLLDGISMRIGVREKRQERNREEDTRQAAEFYDTTESVAQEFLKLKELSTDATKEEVAPRLQEAAERYMQAIKTEGSFLYRNMQGMEVFPEGHTAFNANQRIAYLLQMRQETSRFLSETFAEKYQGTVDTVQAATRYTDYLLRNPTQVDVPTLQKALEAKRKEFANMAARTDSLATAQVNDVLAMDKEQLPKLDPEQLKTYQTALQDYLAQIKTEGSFLFKNHEHAHKERIAVLKDTQANVQATLRVIEKGLSPAQRADHMTAEELLEEEKREPLTDKVESLTIEDKKTVLRLQDKLKKATTGTLAEMTSALHAAQKYNESVASLAANPKHANFAPTALRAQAIVRELETRVESEKLKKVEEEYDAQFMTEGEYKLTTDATALESMTPEQKAAHRALLKIEYTFFSKHPVLAKQYPKRVEALKKAGKLLQPKKSVK